MNDCPKGHVWVTYPNAKVSVCKNCGSHMPVTPLPYNDPLRVKERELRTAAWQREKMKLVEDRQASDDWENKEPSS